MDSYILLWEKDQNVKKSVDLTPCNHPSFTVIPVDGSFWMGSCLKAVVPKCVVFTFFGHYLDSSVQVFHLKMDVFWCFQRKEIICDAIWRNTSVRLITIVLKIAHFAQPNIGMHCILSGKAGAFHGLLYVLYFCSQFWLCNHVSSNPLDQTWHMAPWQKEGGLRINHSRVSVWFMAPCAGSNQKGIGHSLMFPAKGNTACCDLAQF